MTMNLKALHRLKTSLFLCETGCKLSILALLVLLSTAPAIGYPVTTDSDEATTTSVDISDSGSLTIRDLPFANYIANPCSPGTIRTNDRTRSKAQRQSYTIAFFRYMSSYGTLYKQDVLKVINESTIDDCGLLNLPNLPYTQYTRTAGNG
ncbi:uncharacterized protein CEXT_85221 [Caerostris extrusa]|uniref:Uncharacterized protein n=1 Tax=Caerostris extrusa TaxID=172846 RepID=A0AAV4WS57_CAEEX|nr:uncharacterized protein CEXT_85221 [Caerostris extrusa]